MHPDDSKCVFCPSSGRQPWFNTPISTDGGDTIAVPSIGSFTPGYLLIIPVIHVTALCGIPYKQRQSFLNFATATLRRLRKHYGEDVTIFEHGACDSPMDRRSACISHAHLHAVPGSYDLCSAVATRDSTQYESLASCLAVRRTAPYLMLQDPRGPVIVTDDVGVPQFFRRAIAKRLGMPEKWDFALYPFFDNIRSTYREFGIKFDGRSNGSDTSGLREGRATDDR